MRSGPGGKRARKAPPGGVRAEKGRSPTYVGAAGVALVATVFFAAMRGRLTAPPSALDSPPSRPVPAREARGPRVRHERAAEAGVAEAGPAEAAEQCVDLSEHCAYWAANGECASNPPYMLAECAASCGACAGARARADGASDEEDEVLRERRRAWPKCKDKAAECPLWARAGECAKNERYMMVQCALSCASCEMQDFATRCKRDPNATPAVLPGQMDEMFARIETSPEYARYAPRVVSRDPWIVVLDEFMSADEADEIVRVAMRDEGVHFTASQGTSGIDEDGTLIPTVSSYRTSHTNWCEDECIDQPAVAAVRQRVVSITGVPDVNHEFPQILRYTHSQYYNEVRRDPTERQVAVRPSGGAMRRLSRLPL